MKNKSSIIILAFIAVLLVGVLAYIGINSLPGGETPQGDVAENEEQDVDNAPDEEIDDEELFDIEIGKKAPNFTLENLKGETVSLEDYRGKIVFINFWATWCPYCIEEMPDLDKLYMENKEDMVVLAVDVQESLNQVKKFVDEGGYHFPVLLDKNGEVATSYLIRYFPTTYVVDQEGIIRNIKMSMMTYPEMKQMLDHVKGQ